MRQLLQNFLAVLLLFLLISALFSLFSAESTKPEEISLTALADKINQGRVKEIVVRDTNLEIKLDGDKKALSKKEAGVSLPETLLTLGAEKEQLAKVNIKVQERQDVWVWLAPLLLTLLPLLIIVAFLTLLFRRAQGTAMRAFDFTQARARLFGKGGAPLKEKITFDDVAGLEEAKEELKEVVDFLKNPQKFLKMGARIPRGVLLIGSPGTGKTLLARAVAGQADVPFFSIAGSEFVELFVGVGSARTRDLFSKAKAHQPSIIFIDELDAIGRIRSVGVGGAHEEREQTLNQILVEMDGFERDSKVIVMGASNRGDILDPALLRPGRFDRRIVLDLPDVKEREAILKIHAKGKPLAQKTNLKEIAERTPGFSGADLANLMNEAALLAARRNKNFIEQTELAEAIEKVMLGPERKSHILSPEEKKIAAYHEAGHAIVGTMLPGMGPVRKISIVSRGMAAGYTLKTATEEKKLKTKKEFLNELAMLLGGYCAEEIIFKEITTGAANDLQKASLIARKLVKEYGMSALGPIAFGERPPITFFGDFYEERDYSEKMAAKIDLEVDKIIKEAKKISEDVLKKNLPILRKVAQRLLEKETIEREEFEALIGQKQQNSDKNR